VRLLVAEDGGVTVEAEPLGEPFATAPTGDYPSTGVPVEAGPLGEPSSGPSLRVALGLAPVDSSDPFLYHKTTHREVYRRALAARPGYDDVILWNERGEVTESCLANVVVEIEGRRCTPPVECGLLAGTYRGWLLEQGLVEERVITRDALGRATRVFLLNSVRGEREVRVDLPSRG